MNQTQDDIATLAEGIGISYLFDGKVSLEGIAKKNRISFIEGNYDNHFLGQLIHHARKFYIILNMDSLSKSESGRVRFTIAHELGHYFIDRHRTNLAKGISLSFNGEFSTGECKEIENNANHFASHLLMPKKLFTGLASNYEPGFRGILVLKEKFDTSIYATTKHYIHLDLTPCIMIKWHPNSSFHYAQYSNSFSKLTGIKGKPPIKFDPNYVVSLFDTIYAGDLEYIEQVTPISRWISTVTPGSKNDVLGLEQTIKLGDFGGITLLLFNY